MSTIASHSGETVSGVTTTQPVTDPFAKYGALMTYEEVCEAVKQHRRTIERKIELGQFPQPLQPGGPGTAIHFRRVDIAAHVANGLKPIRRVRKKK